MDVGGKIVSRKQENQENAAMNEAAVRQKIAELTRMLQAAPVAKNAKNAKNAAGAGVYVPAEAPAGQSLPQKLDELRLQLNYLLFDLEATRRENRYLMQMLESRRNPKRGEDDLQSF